MSRTCTRLEYAPMASLSIRTWNLFHGRTVPPSGKTFLREAIDLVTRDRPALVCLQEVPVWAISRLEQWSGMRASAAVTAPALGGPLAQRLTALDPDRLRSALAGRANAVLVGARSPFARSRRWRSTRGGFVDARADGSVFRARLPAAGARTAASFSSYGSRRTAARPLF